MSLTLPAHVANSSATRVTEARLSNPATAAVQCVSVVGCGNSARALSAHLAANGSAVKLLVRNVESAAEIAEQHCIRATGKLEGEFPVEAVTSEPSEAVGDAETIFVATVTTAYEEVARCLAAHLKPQQQVVLFSGKFGGVVHFTNILAQCGVINANVVETDALFACRTLEDGSIWIRGFKEWTLYSAPTRSGTIERGKNLLNFFPALQAADNVVQRGLTDFGALTHALTMMVNMNRIDRGESFLFYQDGFTERTIVLLERMEREFRSVAEAYGTSLIPMSELLNRYYGCDTSSLLAAMRSVPNYRTSQAPLLLRHRYIEEDVACSLVPISQLAEVAGLRTPTIDAVINFAGTLLDVDFDRTGRSLEKLGWSGMNHEEIAAAINA